MRNEVPKPTSDTPVSDSETGHETGLSLEEVCREVLRDIALEQHGALTLASEAAGRSRDVLPRHLRDAQKVRLWDIDSYLAGWSYPKHEFIARVRARLTNGEISAVDDLTPWRLPEGLLQGFLEGEEPQSVELRQALEIDDLSSPGDQYETEVSRHIADIKSLTGIDRSAALLLANRMLGELVLRPKQRQSNRSYTFDLAATLAAWASANRSVGNYRQAGLALLKVLDLTRRHSTTRLRADALQRTAHMLRDFGEPSSGLLVLNEALAIYTLGGDRTGIARACLSRGSLCYFSGRFRESVRWYRSVRERQSELPIVYRAASLVGLGRAWAALQEPSECEGIFSELEAVESGLDPAALAASYWARADWYVRMAEQERALSTFRQLWPLACRQLEPHDVFSIFASFGELLRQLGSRGELCSVARDLSGLTSFVPKVLPERAAVMKAVDVLQRIEDTARLPFAVAELIVAASRLRQPVAWKSS